MNSPDSTWTIGIDVGGTKIAAGLLSFPDGRILAQRRQPTRPTRCGEAVLDDVVTVARDLAAEACDQGREVKGIGLSVCELVDREGNVVSANAVPWRGLSILGELSDLAPAVIEADVRAGALAEATFGAGRSFRNFVYVTIGTGISCCLMLDGVPYMGSRGIPGTMASSPLVVPCEQCEHVSRRSLEDLAAGPALVARFQAGGGQAAEGADVLKAAAEGNDLARQVLQSSAEALAAQVGLLVNVLDPEAIIIGGGLGLSEGLYWEHFLGTVRPHIWSEVHRNLPILRAITGVEAEWMGAAIRAAQHFQQRHHKTNLSK